MKMIPSELTEVTGMERAEIPRNDQEIGRRILIEIQFHWEGKLLLFRHVEFNLVQFVIIIRNANLKV